MQAQRDLLRHEITVREANSSDVATFAGEMKSPTLRGWVGEIDGKAVALGGLANVHGRWIAFLDVTDEGRGYLKSSLAVRKALIRTARLIMQEARKQGVRFAYADADMRFPLADKMLERIGFTMKPGSDVYRWKP